MAEIFEMGGYAAFIWPAYVITAFLMLALALHSFFDWKTQNRLLRALEGHNEIRNGETRLRAPARERSQQERIADHPQDGA